MAQNPPYTDNPDFDSWSFSLTTEVNGLRARGAIARGRAPENDCDQYGVIGQITNDSDYAYIKISSNPHRWKRWTISSW